VRRASSLPTFSRRACRSAGGDAALGAGLHVVRSEKGLNAAAYGSHRENRVTHKETSTDEPCNNPSL
jgi:hypothetical protein